jgi:medium-chain acyl-[acyl-carrier-protein] hydrolase
MNEVCVRTPKPFAYLKKSQSIEARLFAFHHAGGCASTYHPWVNLLSEGIELIAGQLPGRGSRFSEPFLKTIDEAVAEVVNAIPPLLDRPSFFFGHSLGSILAYEVIVNLVQKGEQSPKALFVSGEIPPQVFFDTMQKFTDSTDEEFVKKILSYHGIPEVVLQDEDLFELLMPRFRADFKMAESYKYVPKEPLHIPIVVMSGKDDDTINDEDLERWQKLTTKPIKIKMFPGDHFYLNQDRRSVLKFLLQEMDSIH